MSDDDTIVELVCPSRAHGVAINASGTLDTYCRGGNCKTAQGGSVVHRFDLATGEYKTRLPDRSIVYRARNKEKRHGRR